MAVFRSDQSQLTYAMESAPGGDIELKTARDKHLVDIKLELMVLYQQEQLRL